MLKQYRRRFIAATTGLVGAALLVMFIALGVTMYRNVYTELRNTMSMVLRPWNEAGDGFQSLRPSDRPDPPERPDGTPPRHGQTDRITDEAIVTVFYNKASGEISVLSDTTLDDDGAQLAAAIERITTLANDFGTLNDEGLIYCREGQDAFCKIALTDVSYARTRILNRLLTLAALFVASLALVFLISLLLAKRAARPMEDAIRMERQFVADISHDLKTPITVILANNSILKLNPDAKVSEQEQWLESTDTAAKNMMTLVNEMLTLSALESTERKAEKTAVDLSEAAEKSVLQMESLTYDRGVILESDIDPGITILANREYTERICNGLIENAIKYEPVGGRVTVTLKRNRKTATLTVRNSGSVIAEEDLPHIFERFYRGDKARTSQDGHGLGLPIIRQMAESFGAEIRAVSSPEDGTAFLVTVSIVD
ncbi:MAG: HAMP domain-containing histidine kinase [Eubacteriales bacterium]|nr:HAMP domain-containing histidine kinase [Eubacteriales bacterium]